jgi:hypothetical protein
MLNAECSSDLTGARKEGSNFAGGENRKGWKALRTLQSRTNKHRTLDNCIESQGKVVRIRLQQIPNGSKEEGPSHEIRRRILAQDY